MFKIHHALSLSELTDLAFILGAQTKQQDRYLALFEASGTRIEAVFKSNRGSSVKDVRETVYRLPDCQFNSEHNALQFVCEKAMDFNALMGIHVDACLQTENPTGNVVQLRVVDN